MISPILNPPPIWTISPREMTTFGFVLVKWCVISTNAAAQLFTIAADSAPHNTATALSM